MALKITPTDKEVLMAYADCNMCVSDVARKIHMNRNNVDYHIEKVRSLTGLDPCNFHDLTELLRRIENSEL